MNANKWGKSSLKLSTVWGLSKPRKGQWIRAKTALCCLMSLKPTRPPKLSDKEGRIIEKANLITDQMRPRNILMKWRNQLLLKTIPKTGLSIREQLQ